MKRRRYLLGAVLLSLWGLALLGGCTSSVSVEQDSPPKGQTLPPPSITTVPAPSRATVLSGESLGTPASDVLRPSPTLVSTSTPLPEIPMPLFGVEPRHPTDERVLTLLSQSGARLVRYGSVLWEAVEPQEGVYRWDTLAGMDAALESLSRQGVEIILVVRSAPLWAQKRYGIVCGPIAQEKFAAFADFMTQLVKRYSAPPYNVRYWELGNEPDVDPSLVRADSSLGCWGDKDDPYYGGGYYAEMLKVVYPAIKAADPRAQVLNGGLLLDCDPTNSSESAECHAATFFEGMMRNGGGDYLDIVNFHGYPPFVKNSLLMDAHHPGWVARGGVVVGKIDYLREVMGRYGVDKPLFLTETSLLCPEWNKQDCTPPQDVFYQKQADYVVRRFVENWALGIAGTIWYDFEGQGWRYASMVGGDLDNPAPAFYAFQYLNRKLSGMLLTGAMDTLPGVQGYTFLSPQGGKTWVLWSIDESPQTIVLPPGVTAVYDRYGQEIPLATGPELEITSPVYVDIAP